jgi:hypothetical protein
VGKIYYQANGDKQDFFFFIHLPSPYPNQGFFEGFFFSIFSLFSLKVSITTAALSGQK